MIDEVRKKRKKRDKIYKKMSKQVIMTTFAELRCWQPLFL